MSETPTNTSQVNPETQELPCSKEDFDALCKKVTDLEAKNVSHRIKREAMDKEIVNLGRVTRDQKIQISELGDKLVGA